MEALDYLGDKAFDLKLLEHFLLVELRVDDFVEFEILCLTALARAGCLLINPAFTTLELLEICLLT